MKKVMFACKKNSCRSQMAEGFAKTLGQGLIGVTSSGLEASRVHPTAIEVMKEIGIDITDQSSKPISDFVPEDYDAVISLCGCGVNLPEAWLLQEIFEDWQLDDPDGQPLETFHRVRDEIKVRVEGLIAKLVSYPDYVWWVKPGLLGGMSRPPLEDLPQLYAAGARGIVSVMDEPSGIKEYQEAGFAALWVPITGGKAPTVDQVKEFVAFADPILANHQPVIVHCTSGNRRTGTLLASYLIAKGEDIQPTLDLIQKVRPTAELREAQINFLTELPGLMG